MLLRLSPTARPFFCLLDAGDGSFNMIQVPSGGYNQHLVFLGGVRSAGCRTRTEVRRGSVAATAHDRRH